MSSDNKELTTLTGLNRTKQWFETAIPRPTVKQSFNEVSGLTSSGTRKSGASGGKSIIDGIL